MQADTPKNTPTINQQRIARPMRGRSLPQLAPKCVCKKHFIATLNGVAKAPVSGTGRADG